MIKLIYNESCVTLTFDTRNTVQEFLYKIYIHRYLTTGINFSYNSWSSGDGIRELTYTSYWFTLFRPSELNVYVNYSAPQLLSAISMSVCKLFYIF